MAPHTDWGILTVLDRQPGYGGPQVQGLDGSWADAPDVPDAFTVNVADRELAATVPAASA